MRWWLAELNEWFQIYKTIKIEKSAQFYPPWHLNQYSNKAIQKFLGNAMYFIGGLPILPIAAIEYKFNKTKRRKRENSSL